MTIPAIELKDVQKNFGNISIIRDLNLNVAQGERHALIGPNGAGKSTTFQSHKWIHKADIRDG